MNKSPTRGLIIGVGNPYRGDDGAGVAVARQLVGKVPKGMQVLEESGEGTALVEAWQGAVFVIVVDATQSGAAPGTIHRFDACREHLAGELHRSTHAFGLSGAIELARALHELPEHLVVYGIEGQDFTPGEGLSPAVQKAIPRTAERILSEAMCGRMPEIEPAEQCVSDDAVHVLA